MNKTKITHICGHEREYELKGDHKKQAGMQIWLEGQPCWRCKRKQQLPEIYERAKQEGLPMLDGSDKQVDWAMEIRHNALMEIDKLCNFENLKKILDKRNIKTAKEISGKVGISNSQDLYELLDEVALTVKRIPEAKWWIDNRKEGFENAVDWAMGKCVDDRIETNNGNSLIVEIPYKESDSK